MRIICIKMLTTTQI